MKEKLQLLMDYTGLKQGRFAELLDANPASISHILAGRNKPSFDLLQKILLRFPQISPDWLLLDSGPMLRDENGAGPNASVISDNGTTRPIDGGLFDQTDTPSPAIATSQTPNPAAPRPAGTEAPTLPLGITGRPDAKITRVVLFYDDRTFESFSPVE